MSNVAIHHSHTRNLSIMCLDFRLPIRYRIDDDPCVLFLFCDNGSAAKGFQVEINFHLEGVRAEHLQHSRLIVPLTKKITQKTTMHTLPLPLKGASLWVSLQKNVKCYLERSVDDPLKS